MESELKKYRQLNRLEFLSLAKDYLFAYIVSMIHDEDSENRRRLVSKLKKYFDITREENSILKYIINSLDKIKDEDTLDELLNKIDFQNERTFLYFESLISDYLDDIRLGRRCVFSNKDVSSLLTSDSIKNEVVGLTLSDEDLLYYYRNNEAIYYLLEHTKVIDAPSDDYDFYGCFPKEEDGILKSLLICVPSIVNLKTMLINIHEFKHGIDLYPYIGSSYPEMDYEKSAKEEETNFIKSLTIRNVK